MSRNRELCLSGWVIDSNLLDNDMRFVDLLETKGALSIVIYIIMRGLICTQNGYYAQLSDSFILTIHRKLTRCSKGQAHIKAIIEYFGEIGILDKCSLASNVLTSADIQEAWLAAKRAKRQKITSNLEHWLLVDTLPSTFYDNCSNNVNNCYNNSDCCSNKDDNCTQDKTQHDSKFNNQSTINDNKQTTLNDVYTVDTILDIILHKDTTGLAVKSFKNHPQYEYYYKYATYLADACNDTRLNKYGGDDYYIDNEFFRAWVREVNWQGLFRLFADCYLQHNNIRESCAYYLRGIIYNKYKKLAIKHKKRFEA